MKTRISLVIISLLLVCAMAVNLTGCAMEVQAKDLMDGITPNQVNALDDLGSQNADVTDLQSGCLRRAKKVVRTR